MSPLVLTLAGLWNSGPQHWQTHWEARHPQWSRVPHREWQTPDKDEWVAELDRAIAACERPPVLAAHSLACTLVAHWAASGSPHKIAGAFLVAPSDVEAPSYPSGTTGFAPMPLQALPFPSLVVASGDDPYVSFARARAFAAAWGSDFTMIGDAGHINGDAGYGAWPDGEQLLLDFCAAHQP
ncbi:RBBP9/YdeN family alpha/beta hydrolase [Janthinobacterium lividum]|uniref:Alpha/beta hydrolase n=1 Tax=Janthinobacterium lividum TaxID=29581 RepID=A0AAJ4MX34_9BURK|nr:MULTISPECIES: alpha/beta hydrolase [Janthinobacterium]KAB0332129.1 alpha/beta hydrolase [Janthinobacterium lividum]QSX98322.1 alpha/beta hydrolase [Janthinobacterium lividum]UGQ38312.1 alpha/beta hydrolase [Janthinobacterium sp. PLB04]